MPYKCRARTRVKVTSQIPETKTTYRSIQIVGCCIYTSTFPFHAWIEKVRLLVYPAPTRGRFKAKSLYKSDNPWCSRSVAANHLSLSSLGLGFKSRREHFRKRTRLSRLITVVISISKFTEFFFSFPLRTGKWQQQFAALPWNECTMQLVPFTSRGKNWQKCFKSVVVSNNIIEGTFNGLGNE